MSMWRARIDTTDGMTLGAGSLVAPRTVLTCAHLVDGRNEVLVAFPGEAEGLAAEVHRITGWEKPGNRGDVALVRLKNDAPVEPARLAAPDTYLPGATLRAYGFRRGMEGPGTYVTLLTGPDMMQQREWQQLNVDDRGQERLTEGFSGAAVYLVETDEIVGMVTDADLEGDGRLGRMLPLATLRRYWDGLDDRLPLRWLSAGLRIALRRIVHARSTDRPLSEIYLRAFSEPAPPHGFGSVWEAIRYVAEERFEEDRLACFLDHLTSALPVESATELSAWRRRVLPEAERPRGRATQASILIRLERQTRDGSFDLTLCTLIGDRLGRRLPTIQVKPEQVRAQVEKSLPQLLPDVVGSDWMFEFALPESWLGKPVEEWKADAGHRMLSRPVVVRDVERMKPAMRQDEATRRWARLRARAEAHPVPPTPVSCREGRPRHRFYAWLDADPDAAILVHAQKPRSPYLSAALDVGIPVMIWPRTACSDTPHDECTGHVRLHTLVQQIAGTHPDDLPELVMMLRKQAIAAEDGTSHCGRKLTLFWDDPARLPDPPLAMGR